MTHPPVHDFFHAVHTPKHCRRNAKGQNGLYPMRGRRWLDCCETRWCELTVLRSATTCADRPPPIYLPWASSFFWSNSRASRSVNLGAVAGCKAWRRADGISTRRPLAKTVQSVSAAVLQTTSQHSNSNPLSRDRRFQWCKFMRSHGGRRTIFVREGSPTSRKHTRTLVKVKRHSIAICLTRACSSRRACRRAQSVSGRTMPRLVLVAVPRQYELAELRAQT